MPNDIIENINTKLTYYKVVLASKVIGEEGKYIESDKVEGYGIVNTLTGVTEHTSLILPGVIFQAQHFDSTLKSLLTADEVPASVNEAPVGDVVLN